MKRLALALLVGCGFAFDLVVASDADSVERDFLRAAENGRLASEALGRCHRYLEGWLAHADPVTGLVPRNLRESRDYWNGRDAGADNYAFMVLTAALTDRPLLEGRLRDMLRTERKLTARHGRLCDDYDFSTRTWRRQPFDLEASIFDSAEYVKDGLLPILEWLGPSPWSDRAIELVDEIWKNAGIATPFGTLATSNFEVNGDLLQACSRLHWFTGETRYLDWAQRLADYYLLGTHHPTRNLASLRLRDHGGEVVNGLTEAYVALSHRRPERAAAYRQPLREMLDGILDAARNEDGLLYDWFEPRTGRRAATVADTWGYVFDGFYTVHLLESVPRYREAVRTALGVLEARYANFPWERDSADGYADAIEGALNLYRREPLASTRRWLDSEIGVMWAKQRPDGIIEGWHGDGNFARTSLMYALWKSQGLHVEPWREDVRLGAVVRNGRLHVSLSAETPWRGRLHFDRPRHREFLRLPLDYPRINQFPEWFVVARRGRWAVEESAGGGASIRWYSAGRLRGGLALELEGGGERRLTVWTESAEAGGGFGLDESPSDGDER